MKLQSIQGLRAVAASAVVVGHCGNFALGSAGVDLFFVISGFIIATVAPGRKPLAFLRDRAWRIYPIYYVYLAPWFAVAIYAGLTTWQGTLASFTLWPVYGEIVRPYLKLAWTLTFEMLFYVAAAIALRHGVRPMLVAFALCLLAFQIWPTPLLSFLGNPMILEFLAGVLIARLPRSEAGGALLPLGILLFVLSDAALFKDPPSAIDASVSIDRVIAWGVPAALVVYGALCLERFAKIRPLVLIGDASYTIYLSHLLLSLMSLLWWIEAPLLILIGVALYLLIEKPLLAAKSGVRDRERRGVPPGVRDGAGFRAGAAG